MGGGMQAVRPQLFAQEPSRRLRAGQVEAYLYIGLWQALLRLLLAGLQLVLVVATAGAARTPGSLYCPGSSPWPFALARRPVQSRSPREEI